jgi:hypothetical protein
MTIHKSQGITMEKAVLNLVEERFRTRTVICGGIRGQIPEGLMLEGGFNLSRFQSKEGNRGNEACGC